MMTGREQFASGRIGHLHQRSPFTLGVILLWSGCQHIKHGVFRVYRPLFAFAIPY
jgi:hypothetical protein